MNLAGVGTLLRAHLRRDRWMLLWWTAGIVALYASQPPSIRATYPTQAELDTAARAADGNPALVAMTGPARALDTIGGQVAWQTVAYGAMALGLMSMFLLGRHLRAEEESGRDELVRSGVVGRAAPLAAAAALVVAADVVVGLLVLMAMVGSGLPWAGSLVLATGLVGCGLVLGAVALVAMQLTTSVRAAYGITGVVVAAAYVLRAVGDVGDGTLSWCSPIGWAQAMRPYSGDRWWPALLFVPSTVLLTGLAVALLGRRDLGAGLWAGRPGPATGRLGAWSLPWRLQRAAVAGWAAGIGLLGLAYGSLGDGIGDLVGDGDLARDVLGLDGADVVAGFHATTIGVIALVSCGFAVSSALRLGGEESDGRAELLLATPSPRRIWWTAHAVVVAVGTAVVVAAGGLGLGAGYALTTGDSGAVVRLTLDATASVPAAWALGAVALLLHGWLPRAAVAAWAAVAACGALLLLGALLKLPDAVTHLSPFEVLARVPAEPWRAGPFVVVLLASVGLALAGLVGTLRRDVAAG